MSLDSIFTELAEAFCGARIARGDVALPDSLARASLDYSLESLRIVDAYLERVASADPTTVTADEYDLTVLRCGAYVGAVLRLNCARRFQWVSYDDYLQIDPAVASFMPKALPTSAVLVRDDHGYMTLPLNKVARFLEEGPQHSVYAYVDAELSEHRRSLLD